MLLVPKFLAKTPIIIKVSDGLDENGDMKILTEVSTKAKVEDTNTVVYTPDGGKSVLKKKAFVFDQISGLPAGLSGKCIVDNASYEIFSARLLRNPDGTRNHFVLELM